MDRRIDSFQEPSHFPPTARLPVLGSQVATTRIAIIEPNRAKSELLQYFCATHWNFAVVALEKTGTGGIAAVDRTVPELILAALTPADIDTVEFITRLGNACPGAKLVLLTTQCSEFLLHAVRACRYDGLIFEPEESLSSLSSAIEGIRQGSQFISGHIAEQQKQLRSAGDAFPKLLSNREQQVLLCIGQSMSDEEIAAHLECSSATAHCHRRQVMRKLRIHSTPKLIRYCIDKGFVSVAAPACHRALDHRSRTSSLS